MRDAWLLCDHKACSDMSDSDFDNAVRELAADYQIDSGDIWDMLPEIYDFN
jgi:hypothetical protein